MSILVGAVERGEADRRAFHASRPASAALPSRSPNAASSSAVGGPGLAAAPACSRRRSVPRCWRGRFRASSGASAGRIRPQRECRDARCAHHRATSQVVPSLESFSTMPMRGEFVADAVGLGEVLRLARGVAGGDPALDLLARRAPAAGACSACHAFSSPGRKPKKPQRAGQRLAAGARSSGRAARRSPSAC